MLLPVFFGLIMVFWHTILQYNDTKFRPKVIWTLLSMLLQQTLRVAAYWQYYAFGGSYHGDIRYTLTTKPVISITKSNKQKY